MSVKPEVADAVALLRSVLHGDTAAVRALLEMLDPAGLVGGIVGILAGMLEGCGVTQVDIDARLAEWQRDLCCG